MQIKSNPKKHIFWNDPTLENRLAAATSPHWLEPVREPMRLRDYVGATILTAAAFALGWFGLAGTP